MPAEDRQDAPETKPPALPDIKAITSVLTFANVYTLGLTALRESSEPAQGFRTTISPSYLVMEDRVDYLFSAKCHALTDENERVATITVELIATFDRPQDDSTDFSAEQVSTFGGKVALYAAYPYIRESIQSLGSRLGLPNLTMDLLKRGRPLPPGLTIGPEERLTDADADE